MNFSVEHLGVAAQDAAALRDWYVRVLEASVVFDNEQDPPTCFLKLPGGVQIEIYPADRAMPETSNNKLGGWRHLALQVSSLDAAREHLTARGVTFDSEIRAATGGGSIQFFHDPEGNLLHLVERPCDSLFRRA